MPAASEPPVEPPPVAESVTAVEGLAIVRPPPLADAVIAAAGEVIDWPPPVAVAVGAAAGADVADCAAISFLRVPDAPCVLSRANVVPLVVIDGAT